MIFRAAAFITLSACSVAAEGPFSMLGSKDGRRLDHKNNGCGEYTCDGDSDCESGESCFINQDMANPNSYTLRGRRLFGGMQCPPGICLGTDLFPACMKECDAMKSTVTSGIFDDPDYAPPRDEQCVLMSDLKAQCFKEMATDNKPCDAFSNPSSNSFIETHKLWCSYGEAGVCGLETFGAGGPSDLVCTNEECRYDFAQFIWRQNMKVAGFPADGPFPPLETFNFMTALAFGCNNCGETSADGSFPGHQDFGEWINWVIEDHSRFCELSRTNKDCDFSEGIYENYWKVAYIDLCNQGSVDYCFDNYDDYMQKTCAGK